MYSAESLQFTGQQKGGSNGPKRFSAYKAFRIRRGDGALNRLDSATERNLVAVKSVLAFCLFASVPFQGQSPLVIDTDEFRYTATYDPSRISKSRLRELLLLSPYDFSASGAEVDHETILMGFEEIADKLRKGPLASPLEQCVDTDPHYSRCGRRDISDPNFLRNAQINVDRNEQVLAALSRLNVPAELSSILQQFRDSMTFYSTIERRRLEYLQTGDLQILSQPVVKLDPLKTCKKEIEELRKAPTSQRRYELSHNNWPNCLNLEWDPLSPAYARQAWSSFLRAYGVSEKYTLKDID
jgi:hypothetical protein